jgi:hypothetical protein
MRQHPEQANPEHDSESLSAADPLRIPRNRPKKGRERISLKLSNGISGSLSASWVNKNVSNDDTRNHRRNQGND